MDAYSVVQDIKAMADGLGRPPKRDEYFYGIGVSDSGKFTISQAQQLLGVKTWGEMLEKCGLGRFSGLRTKPAEIVVIEKMSESLDAHTTGKKKFKYIQPMKDQKNLLSYHTVDLPSIFKCFGNPEFIRALAMPDVHVEHMDPWAVNCFLEVVAYIKPQIFINLGDFLNAGGVSHWDSDSLDPKRFVPEVLKARELLGVINSLLPKDCEKIFTCGNHEDWVRQFLISSHNPQLFDGIDKIGYDFSIPALIGLPELGFQFFPLNQIVRIGKMAVAHGMYTGANHAKKHLDAVKGSIFYGHLHDTKGYVDVGMDGLVVAQSLGTLANLCPKFLRGLLNNWEHAFGEFCIFPDGSFIHTVPKILNGKCMINGKIFRA